MELKYNPFTRTLDYVNTPLVNPLLFKGEINANSDFPTSAEVDNGWFYTIGTDVTDNNATKTNTGQSFTDGDEIAWNGTNWTIMGNENDWLARDGSNANSNINIGAYDFTTTGSISAEALGAEVITVSTVGDARDAEINFDVDENYDIEFNFKENNVSVGAFQYDTSANQMIFSNLVDSPSAHMSFQVRNTEKMLLTGSGLLGVGGIDPRDYSSSANDVVIGGDGQRGISIVSTDHNPTNLFFSDGVTGSEQYVGYLQYSHSDNSLAFGVNAGEKMTIESNGNVGIGITAPVRLLDISGDSPQLRLTNGATYTDISTRDTGYFSINPSGKLVGIRTNTPEGLFHVYNTASGGAAAIAGSDLMILENNTHTYFNMKTPANAIGGFLFSDDVRGDGYIYYDHRVPAFRFGVGTSEKMRLTSTGVGIGTATPSAGLEVANGRIQITSNTVPTAGAGLELGYSTLGTVLAYDRSASAYKQLNLNGSHIGFFNSGVQTAYLTDGKLGVGVDAVSNVLYPLHVSIRDANNDTVSNVMTLDHRLTSGVGANGIGTGFILSGENSVGTRNGMMRFVGLFDDATAATIEGGARIDLNHHGAWTEAFKLNETDCIINKKVGIGTNAPLVKFHVDSGNTGITGRFEDNTNPAVQFTDGSNVGGYINRAGTNLIGVGSQTGTLGLNVNSVTGTSTFLPTGDVDGILIKGTSTSAGFDMHFTKDNTWSFMANDVYSNTDAHSGFFIFRKAAGTLASPATTASGDQVGGLSFRGYDGTNFKQTALITANVDGAVSTGTVPQTLVFSAGTTTATERMRITSGGDVGIGTATPDAKLQVVGDCKFGDDNTNYASFATDGELTLTGTAKVTKSKTFLFNYSRITAQGKPTLVNQGVFFGWSLPIYSSDDEELFTCSCVPTDWDGISDPVFCVAGWLDTANTDKKFKLQCSVNTYDPTTNEVVPSTAVDYTTETTTGTDAQYTSFIVCFTLDASAAGLTAGKPVGIRIRRVAATTAEISGEFVVEGAVVTYVSDKLGEAT